MRLRTQRPPTKRDVYKRQTLKRIAYEAAVTFDKVVLFLRPDARLLFNPISELCNLIGERLFVFIDGVVRHAAEFETFLRLARKSKLALTIIVAERTNEWNVDGESLSPLLDRDHQLRSLSLPEIDALIAKLTQYRCLGVLATKNLEEQRQAVLSYADRQLLVALYEVTSGKSFPDIVFDEYKGIVNDRARRAVSYTHLDVYKRQGYTSSPNRADSCWQDDPLSWCWCIFRSNFADASNQSSVRQGSESIAFR